MKTIVEINQTEFEKFNNNELISVNRNESNSFAETTPKENEMVLVRHMKQELMGKVMKRLDIKLNDDIKNVRLDIKIV